MAEYSRQLRLISMQRTVELGDFMTQYRSIGQLYAERFSALQLL